MIDSRKFLTRSLTLLFLFTFTTTSARAAVKVNQPYPDFLLPQIGNRKPVSLSQYRGKKVLLIQFASW